MAFDIAVMRKFAVIYVKNRLEVFYLEMIMLFVGAALKCNELEVDTEFAAGPLPECVYCKKTRNIQLLTCQYDGVC